MTDSRNVVDEFKGLDHESIVAQLDDRGIGLEIAVENTLRDYNMGTIVRTANAFGVRQVHVIGRRQWNKRGAMMTDKYLTVTYHESIEGFVHAAKSTGRTIYAIENNIEADSLQTTTFVSNAILLFGQEGPGVSPDLLAAADHIVQIDQRGSTRSMNVGVAAGIVIYEWSRQHDN